MVVGEATFVEMGPLEIFGHFAAQIKVQEAGYLYILALREVQPYLDLTKAIAGEAAAELFETRVRTMLREIAGTHRAELRYLYHLETT